jgi:hypothetical protein
MKYAWSLVESKLLIKTFSNGRSKVFGAGTNILEF